MLRPSPNRIIVKLGTRVLTSDDGCIAMDRLTSLIAQMADWAGRGCEVLLVSSGAVGLGRDTLGLPPGPSDLSTRQACAAIGQGRLMGIYEQKFGHHGLVCAQVLLTQSDFDDEQRYSNLSSTLNTLLRHRVIPIINENDVVATEELVYTDSVAAAPPKGPPFRRHGVSFGDNDQLAAILAAKLDADLLILLTDVDGVYDKNPFKHPDAQRIQTWAVSTKVDAQQDPGAGRGGMKSKIRSACHAAQAGCTTVIASGRLDGAIHRVLSDQSTGTWFPAAGHLSPNQQWMLHTARVGGAMYLKPDQIECLQKPQTSLLADSVAKIAGSFQAGEVIEIRALDETPLGRGTASCAADTARAWTGSHALQALPVGPVVLVRWDKLVLGNNQ